MCFKQQLLSADTQHYLTEPEGRYKHLAYLSELFAVFKIRLSCWVSEKALELLCLMQIKELFSKQRLNVAHFQHGSLSYSINKDIVFTGDLDFLKCFIYLNKL